MSKAEEKELSFNEVMNKAAASALRGGLAGMYSSTMQNTVKYKCGLVNCLSYGNQLNLFFFSFLFFSLKLILSVLVL